jgi:hypothetical protein
MKVLVTTRPLDDRFNPFAGIAMNLKASGHDVRWHAGSSYAVKLKRLWTPQPRGIRRATQRILSEPRWKQHMARLRDEVSDYHPYESLQLHFKGGLE